MNSNPEQRQQKTLDRGRSGDVAVNPQGSRGAPSFGSAFIKKDSCEGRTNLMKRVVRRKNVLAAIERVEKNRGAPGVDGMRADELRQYLNRNNMENWKRIKAGLLEGTYKPLPTRRKTIPKPGGGERHLGIPAIIDRMVQQAILQVLSPIFEPGFSKSSFGFRPGRRAHQAVKQAQQSIKEGRRHVVDMDLEKFFDRVNHDILMSRIARKVSDKAVLKVIRSFLESGVMASGCRIATEEGTPQGGPLSPLLANIILDDLDKELEERGHRFCRYADDCNIYVKSRRAGQRVLASVRRFIETRLRLKVNESKSAADRPWKRKFLGFSFTVDKAPRIRIAPQALKRFKDKIRGLTQRNRGISTARRLKEVSRYITGWIGYFRLADTLSVLESLDEWTRRRIRACVLKQWKRSKTKRRKLKALGISDEEARKISGSRKGIWRLANSPQLKKALSNSFLSALGLESIVGSYQRLRLAL